MGNRTHKDDIDRVPTEEPAGTAYDRDFYSWSLEQARLVREGRRDAVGRENVAEEVESSGREQFSKLESAFRVLLLHVLKWDHQPARRSRSWILRSKRSGWYWTRRHFPRRAAIPSTISCPAPINFMMKRETFPIASIYVPAKRRATLDPKRAQEIAESMLAVGQQTPIMVRRDGERYVLIEGLHRLEACKQLGEETIVGYIVQARRH